MADPIDQFSAAEAIAAERVFDVLAGLNSEQVARVLAQVEAKLALDDGAPLFARGIAGPLGKLTCDAKTKIDEVTRDLWLQQCAARGQDTAGALRDCIYVMVHGKTYRQMVLEKFNHDAKRIDALVQLIGPFGAPEFLGGRQ
ncbi:hypothetical protein [Comamonas antarctica]|uniref:hypothetical protein n=1 Tax=Comamonas antarctica TaxID=2743470 RepID=UPI0028E383AD|nr:hypothetical protein [Comamonas antarctica]